VATFQAARVGIGFGPTVTFVHGGQQRSVSVVLVMQRRYTITEAIKPNELNAHI